uniref:Complement C1q tumor necrosis factor-related protein 4-like n=1 Tax=Crassostrea virginica TaxID=6565 RepID=A0A8B8B1U4_CRAVI|nr:complement C1q tumor necrosis factor-related protein 4-like [Crassostrea virginica]
MLAYAFIFAILYGCSDGVWHNSRPDEVAYGHNSQPHADAYGYHGGTIAFTALLSKDTVVGGKAVVKYDRILTNVGGAYSPITGIFTVPYTGIYSISCSLTSSPDNRVHLQITKNGNKLSILYAAETTTPLSGQTLQLLLRRGDKIWIQNRNDWAAKLHDHGSYNLFSGVLIKRMRVRHVHIYS